MVKANAKDIGPTRPANILKIIRNLLKIFSEEVIPVDSPTVAKLEVASKMVFISPISG